MRYYSLSMDKDYTDAPRTINWYGRIDIESLMNCRYEKLESAYALEIKGGCDLYPTDIIMDPIFAVSAMVKHCLEAYEPNLTYTRLYLVQCKEEKVLEYFIPHLVEENCVSNQGGNSRNLLFSNKAVLDIGKVPLDRFLFRTAGDGNKQIIARAEFLESILRRGAKGVHMENIEIRV